MNKIIVVTLLILTICIGCTSNNSQQFTYTLDTNYCLSNAVTCEDVEMQYDMNKLNVSKKASCLSRYDYENITSSTIFKIDCESKTIHIVDYGFSANDKTWSIHG